MTDKAIEGAQRLILNYEGCKSGLDAISKYKYNNKIEIELIDVTPIKQQTERGE